MRWFRKPTTEVPPPAPLRRDKVAAMIQAEMDLEDAIDRDNNEDWEAAHAAGEIAWAGATPAERIYAIEGAERAKDRWSWDLDTFS